MSRVWCVVVSALLALMMQWHGAWGSYAGTASAIIDPSKVKQISWKPRSVCVSARVFFFYQTQVGIQRMMITLIWMVQSFRLRGFPDGIGMRPLDFHRQIGAQEIRGCR
ncbi:hypothetical protein V8G54_032337 [Vigna mungo]|uniref:Secreted protein n=1 Tax=Vigna mungo TaxID=3915 RepID=A0AAQ3MKY1_VIGMU